MSSSISPDTDLLRRLLDGALSEEEQAELMARVESDPCWQRALEELVEGDESWAAAAAHLRQPAEPIDPQLHRAIEQMTSLADWGAESSGSGSIPQETVIYTGDEWRQYLAPADDPQSLGRLGPYRVLEVVGRGGMGIVLRAFDPALHRTVAVKVLAPQLAANPVARRRFVREARAAAAVAHDHVITIHAVEDQGPVPYLVMPLIAARSLQQRINDDGPLPLRDILQIGRQAAEGLAAAHAQGLIHRDIKPANILLEDGVDRVRITDFGLARAINDASLSQSGVIVGTPQYMAPEQARGEAVDHRADLFSLGSVLYAMCTGRPPFRGSTVLGVLRRVATMMPPPIPDLNPEIPEWLCVIIAKLHAKRPEERYQSAAEVAELLAKLLARLQHPIRLRHAPASLEIVPVESGVAVVDQAVATPRRRPGTRAIVAAALALLVAAAGAVGLGYQQGWLWFAASPPPAPDDEWTAPSLIEPLADWAASIPSPGLCGVWDSPLGEFELSHAPIEGREKVVVRGTYSGGLHAILEGSYHPATRVFHCLLDGYPGGELTLELSPDGRTLTGEQERNFGGGLFSRAFRTPWTMTLKVRRPCE